MCFDILYELALAHWHTHTNACIYFQLAFLRSRKTGCHCTSTPNTDQHTASIVEIMAVVVVVHASVQCAIISNCCAVLDEMRGDQNRTRKQKQRA